MIPKAHEAQAYDAREFSRLKQLVATGEGQYLEFKRKASYPAKIVREMIAFANSQGGVLLVGVNDDGGIPGLKHPDGESYAIHQALKQCRPTLKLTEDFIVIRDGRWVIRYTIPESDRKMHYILTEGQLKVSYVRVADQSIKASREMREIMRRTRRQQGVRFHFGEEEKFLMQYLEQHPSITLHEFMRLRKLGRFRASKKLILLVLANVLCITPHEKGDLYTRATPVEDDKKMFLKQ